MNKKNKIEIKKHIESVTEGMSFVFDRVSECVIDEDLTVLSIYGWIKNDFVVFLCDVTGKGDVTYWNIITSNKKHSKQLCERYFEGECKHVPCQLFEKWMEASELQSQKMEELKEIAKEKLVFLVCYEKDENQCHRSLVKKLMEGEIKILNKFEKILFSEGLQ